MRDDVERQERVDRDDVVEAVLNFLSLSRGRILEIFEFHRPCRPLVDPLDFRANL